MSDAAPSISILLPTFNGERFLAEQLDSILAQTWMDFELLTIDDGSSDGTAAMLADYATRDGRIGLIPSQGNRGQKARLAELLELARGKWIAFSDQDDIWAPDKLERLVASIGDAALAFGRSELIDSEGRSLNSTLLEALRSPRQPDNRLSMLFRPQVSGHAMLVRREFIAEQALNSEEPYDWLISLLAEFSKGIIYDNEALVFHRLHDANSHNRAVWRFLNPFLVRPRNIILLLGSAEKRRRRFVSRLEFLAASSQVPETPRTVFGDLASSCRAVWFERPRSMNASELRERILFCLRPLAGSAQDFQVVVDFTNWLTLGLAHPSTLVRVHRLVR